MDRQYIQPSRVTKPIQLLAAWLVGLIAIDTAFLVAATRIDRPNWGPAVLVIAAVANVPAFLVCLFLLQTRFRPEMQEDEYYARYLQLERSSETGQEEVVAKEVLIPAASLRAAAGADIVAGDVMARIHPELSDDNEVSVHVNRLLERYGDVRVALKGAGLSVRNVFGREEIGAPQRFLVTVADDVPVQRFQEVLRALKGLGVDAVGRAGEGNGARRIYIGSYGYRTRAVVDVTQKLNAELLSPNLTRRALTALLSPEGP